jgi:hypothetical protein
MELYGTMTDALRATAATLICKEKAAAATALLPAVCTPALWWSKLLRQQQIAL